MRAALYLRVSTTDRDTERQERELRAVAAARGWDVVEVYADNGISGSKGREKRPAFDRLAAGHFSRHVQCDHRAVEDPAGMVRRFRSWLAKSRCCQRRGSATA